jgi:hypothetical protein
MTDTSAIQQQSPGEKLIAYARGLAAKVAESPEAEAARNLVESARGLVVTDEAADVAANDLGAACAKYTKSLKARFAALKEHPKAMVAAINEVEASILGPLAELRAIVDAAQLRWKAEQRRIAEAAERERLRKIREAEAAENQRQRDRLEAEAAAQLAGEEPPPPVEDVPPPAVPEVIAPPPALVRTSAGHSTTVKRLTCELVNAAECDPYWLVLANVTAPKAAFEIVLARGDAKEPGYGRENGTEWRGVRFYYQETMSRSARP